MPKTVLITGATGFVASNLIPKLVKRGYNFPEVCSVNNKKKTLTMILPNKNIFNSARITIF